MKKEMKKEIRLIDANDLKWKIGQVRLYVASLRCGKTIISKILESYQKCVFEEIDNAPTVDAAEVVRCKDCKHRGRETYCPMCFEEWYEIDEGDGYYDSDFTIHDRTIDEGFCDRGERKDNG